MYLHALNLVREPVFVHDQEYKIIFANRAYLALADITLEKAVGRFYYEIFPLREGPFESCRETIETIETIVVNGEAYLNRSIQLQTEIDSLPLHFHILENMRFPEVAKRVLDRLPQKIFVKDTNLDYIFVNEAYSRALGLATPEAIVGRNDLEFHPKKLANKYRSDDKRLMQANLQEDIVEPYFENGEEFVLHTQKMPFYDTSGQIIGIMGISEDITDKKHSEEEIRALNAELEHKVLERTVDLQNAYNKLEIIKQSADEASEFTESIINTVREPLISLDQDLRVVSVSRSFYDFFKVKPEDTVGQLIYDLGNKQWDIPKLRELLETILPQQTTFDNYEVEHDFATIGRRIMLLNARQIKQASGKERIILLAIEDITERREIEDGLEKTRIELEIIKQSADEASEFTESIINTVREPLISLDQDLRVVSVSRSFYDFFKVKPEDTVGQLIYDLGNKQWDIPKLRELLETILPQQTTFDNYEVEHDFATIGRRIMLLNARQIKQASGKERIILLAIEDITERREVEDGLEKAHEDLTELTIELKRAAKVKSEFLSNMSHELRTPLNSINGFSEVLYDETFGPLNEKQKQYVNNVLTSGKHLLLLINQILDMAKVEAGKMTLSLSSFAMPALLNEISMLVADLIHKNKLHLLLEIAEDLPNIEGDELKVKEIIYNLLSNAIKFSHEGGEIGIRAMRTDSNIEIVIWDSGIGIAPENMEKIFEGFFRVDTPYSSITEGTGLGLPLSKKLVELHGGKLVVESEGLNKGTSVGFTLPIHSEKGDVQ